MNEIFSEIGIIIVAASLCGLLVRLIKLPPLIGYILAGVALGPLGANVVHNEEILEAMHQIGIALLLFLVGLELDWGKARAHMKSAAVLALIQAGGSFAAGFALASASGQSAVTGAYIGAALAFSSTVIVVKFLSESRDINSLHGRLAVGILLVEDLIALIALVIAGGFSAGSSLGMGEQIFLIIVKASSILALVWIIQQYIFPRLFSHLARSAELLFLASLAWCFLLIFTVTRFDLSLEMGAFMAGISLASLPYSLEIITRLRSLRDFFVVLFFASLGSTLLIPVDKYVMLTIGLVAISVFIKPTINFLAMSAYGYRSRTAFLAALTLSQLSEFSIIIVGVGAMRGHISADLTSSITFAAIISILFSTILFGHRNQLYKLLRNTLRKAERHGKHQIVSDEMEERLHDHIIIIGYHRMGYHILKKLHQLGHRVLIVDFNPDIIRKLKAQGIDCVYGDAEDEEIFEAIHLDKASMVVSTIPHDEETLYLIEQVKANKGKTKLIVTAHDIDEALNYYQQGADYVILPHLLGGEHVADLITHYQEHNLGQYMKHRAEELKLLRAKNHALYVD